MKRIVWGIVAVWVLAFPITAKSQERSGRLQLGADVGFQVETLDGTAMAIALSGDYALDRNAAVGPLFQITFSDDLTQVGLSLQGKYTVHLAGNPDLKPRFQGGLGFVHADVDLPGGINRDDTSFLVPVGAGIELRLAEQFYVSSDFLLNFTGLSVSGVNDHSHLAWYFGLRLVL